jgi:hypothetical protein
VLAEALVLALYYLLGALDRPHFVVRSYAHLIPATSPSRLTE